MVFLCLGAWYVTLLILAIAVDTNGDREEDGGYWW